MCALVARYRGDGEASVVPRSVQHAGKHIELGLAGLGAGAAEPVCEAAGIDIGSEAGDAAELGAAIEHALVAALRQRRGGGEALLVHQAHDVAIDHHRGRAGIQGPASLLTSFDVHEASVRS